MTPEERKHHKLKFVALRFLNTRETNREEEANQKKKKVRKPEIKCVTHGSQVDMNIVEVIYSNKIESVYQGYRQRWYRRKLGVNRQCLVSSTPLMFPNMIICKRKLQKLNTKHTLVSINKNKHPNTRKAG